jgi:ATP-dependent RNA circularization protein (DNA/RNA ligase family)
MSSTKSLKLELYSGQILTLDNIDEFTSGYQYFYVRHLDGRTVSFNRKNIRDVIRLLPNNRETGIFLKKPKSRPPDRL